MTDKIEMGAKITAARRAQGMKQYTLAKEAGISPQYMNQIENGKVAVESIGEEILKKIYSYLDMSEEMKPEDKKDKINVKEDNNEEGSNLVSIYDVEKKGWERLEASLRDTIKRQQQTIDFLMELLNKSKDG